MVQCSTINSFKLKLDHHLQQCFRSRVMTQSTASCFTMLHLTLFAFDSIYSVMYRPPSLDTKVIYVILSISLSIEWKKKKIQKKFQLINLDRKNIGGWVTKRCHSKVTCLLVKVFFNVIILEAINRSVAPQLQELLLHRKVDALVMIKDDLLFVCLPHYTQDLLVQLLFMVEVN